MVVREEFPREVTFIQFGGKCSNVLDGKRVGVAWEAHRGMQVQRGLSGLKQHRFIEVFACE